ncbi:MAG: hypothetical protein Kow0062_14040 [Acidobacteriota bacterium]
MSAPRDGRWRVVAALAVAGALVVAAGSIVVGAAVEVWRGGTLVVSVHEAGPDGARIAVALPGALAAVAALAVPAVLPEEAAAQIRPHAPLLRRLATALGELPDATLVAVDGADERVRVMTRAGMLLVEVDDGADQVRIRLPLRAARLALLAVARTAERRG